MKYSNISVARENHLYLSRLFPHHFTVISPFKIKLLKKFIDLFDKIDTH